MAQQFFETLKQEHSEVQSILEKLLNTSDGAVKTKEDLFMQLKQELIPHMKGEEKHFYPLLLNNKESLEIGMEAMEEHHVAETVLKELEALSKDAKNWRAKTTVFAELLSHHIEEEEEEVFGPAEQLLGEKKLNQVMEAFLKEKEEIKKTLK